jgi:hypothetical protein
MWKRLLTSWWIGNRKQEIEGRDHGQHMASKEKPYDLLSPSRPSLLKFPEPPKIELPSRELPFKPQHSAHGF